MTTPTRTPPQLSTRIATATPTDITIRGKSLVGELIGALTFTEMACFQILGRVPTAGETAAIDACLVALMEHGLTPSAIAARLTYGTAPESLQGAVAAGLLGVGDRMVGTVEGCAALLARIAAASDPAAEADAVVAEHRAARRAVPGVGHPIHVPDDPRTPALFAIARARGIAGRHVAAAHELSRAVDAAVGRHLTLNATGAIAAVLADCGVPTEIMRGFALIARCAGLVGHLLEEHHHPAMQAMWDAADRAVPYDPTPGEPR